MLSLLATALFAIPGADVAEPIFPTLTGEPPRVIAHRGASGTYPEHSEPAYRLAFEQGADVLEPDLVMSADGVLIVRHDPYLSVSTDVADHAEFADRRRVHMGRDDWWVSDFTAAELRRLKLRQVMPDRDHDYDDLYPLLSFEDFLDLVAGFQAECGCEVSIEPEVKSPAEYAEAGLDPLPPLLAGLEARGLNRADAPVVIQSFDPAFLRRLGAASPVRKAILHSGDEPGGDMDGLPLDAVARFAQAYGVSKSLLLTPDGQDTGRVAEAHRLGLQVHVWTHRDDRPPVAGRDADEELRLLYALGVDGVFTDHSASALRVREQMAEAVRSRRP